MLYYPPHVSLFTPPPPYHAISGEQHSSCSPCHRTQVGVALRGTAAASTVKWEIGPLNGSARVHKIEGPLEGSNFSIFEILATTTVHCTVLCSLHHIPSLLGIWYFLAHGLFDALNFFAFYAIKSVAG